jgi:hypothetical protein
MKCEQCGKEYYCKPHHLKKYKTHFCSTECRGESQKIKKQCLCGQVFTGRKKHCSKSCANKARIGSIYTGIETKNKYRKIQRLKEELIRTRGCKCERCPYNKEQILVVHHKTERAKGGSDSLDNLELLCPNCHAEHHYGS